MSEREHHLILRFLEGKQTPEEKREFELWLTTSPSNMDMVASYRKIWDASEGKVEIEFDAKEGWNEFTAAVDLKTEVKTRSLSPILKIAAALSSLAVITSVVYLMVSRDNKQVFSAEAPIDVNLPDGSRVHLDANTTITYNDRTVKLEGKALFDVVKDEGKPFVINAGNAVVKVLGTSFYVDARVKDSISVHVLEGIVSLTMNETVQVTKGQHALATPARTAIVDLVFSNARVSDVVRTLRFYFNKNIRLENALIADCLITGSFNGMKLEEIFQTIGNILDTEVKQDNGAYVITGGSCK